MRTIQSTTNNREQHNRTQNDQVHIGHLNSKFSTKKSIGDVQELKNGLDFIKISYFLLNKRAKFKEKTWKPKFRHIM